VAANTASAALNHNPIAAVQISRMVSLKKKPKTEVIEPAVAGILL
jgi:hypothetical protein